MISIIQLVLFMLLSAIKNGQSKSFISHAEPTVTLQTALNLLPFDNKNFSSISETLKCEESELKATGLEWICSVEKGSDFCSCEHKYDCSEKKNLYFSRNYAIQIRKKNMKISIKRGADYQCELALNTLYGREWNCRLFVNSRNVIQDEEIYCSCKNEKECVRHRIVDFY